MPIDPSRAHDAYALCIAGHTSGMGPVLARWTADGLVNGPPAVMAGFAHQLMHSSRRNARMERESLPAIDALIARGIRPVVLKGFHTGHAYFEEPGMRRKAGEGPPPRPKTPWPPWTRSPTSRSP